MSTSIISRATSAPAPAGLAMILVNALGGGVTMGAFCIFGISRTVCKNTAARKTPTQIKGVGIPLEVWAANRDALADQLFTDSKKRVKVSPELDAPQFCYDWVAADPSNVRDTVLMVRGPKRDKLGNEVKKDGAVVETWLEYEGECARLKIAPYVFAEAP